ncbi:sulfurtransferase [Lysobacter cavernae]|uniref:Sulfurtransferase n=1 Tax=Lysobacter cavernae TaxID=1685901 RepID=A0ABV7RJW1_9GAMM
MTSWTTLVSAEELAAALGRDDLVVVDTRVLLSDRDASEAAYREAHIPGARYAHLERDLSDMHKPGAGRHPWPEASDFTAALSRWGIGPGHQVVAYDAGDGALAAARLWFLLRALGHERAAVLDGGWARWCALGLPVDDAVPTPQPVPYAGAFDPQRLLDAPAVQTHLEQGGVLIDVRAAERFRGEVEPLDRVAGHVPGARNRPYALSMRDGRFKPADELAVEFRAALAGHSPDEVVVMCGSGVTACHTLLAMEHAGLRGARLFTGSWSGWIADPARPVALRDA